MSQFEVIQINGYPSAKIYETHLLSVVPKGIFEFRVEIVDIKAFFPFLDIYTNNACVGIIPKGPNTKMKLKHFVGENDGWAIYSGKDTTKIVGRHVTKDASSKLLGQREYRKGDVITVYGLNTTGDLSISFKINGKDFGELFYLEKYEPMQDYPLYFAVTCGQYIHHLRFSWYSKERLARFMDSLFNHTLTQIQTDCKFYWK